MSCMDDDLSWKPEESAQDPELERLLADIGSGGITEIDELDDDQAQLLRIRYGDDDELEDLLDKLRGSDELEA